MLYTYQAKKRRESTPCMDLYCEMISIKKLFFSLSVLFFLFPCNISLLTCILIHVFLFFHLIGLHTLSETGILFWGKKGEKNLSRVTWKKTRILQLFPLPFRVYFPIFVFQRKKKRNESTEYIQKNIFFSL